MHAFRALLACIFAITMMGSVFAQETPEAAYARLHTATLAGRVDEALGFITAATRTELAAKPRAELEGLFRSMAQAMPRTYTVNEQSVDGIAARLSATGKMDLQGNRFDVYLAATLSREGAAWKVAGWSWTNQKPATTAPKPEVPAVRTEAPEPAQVSKIVRRMPGTDPNTPPAPTSAVAAKPVAPSVAARSGSSSRAGLDARACLKLATDSAIRACAEKYR